MMPGMAVTTFAMLVLIASYTREVGPAPAEQ